MPLLSRLLPALLVVTLTFFAGNFAPAQAQVRNPAPADSSSPAGGGNYQNVGVNSLVDKLETLSGKRIVRDANMDSIPPVSVNVVGLSKDEAIRLITITLLLNDVAVTPLDDHTMKAITIGANKNPRSEGLRVFTNAADLPPVDEIVTYYMALDHIDPQEAVRIFSQVAPVHIYGAYTPAPSAQGIILTENSNVIRELIELKKSIDVDRAPNVRPPPPGPHGPGDPRPPGPPHDHPVAKLIGFLFFCAFFVFLVAAGNVLAHRWMNRGKPHVR